MCVFTKETDLSSLKALFVTEYISVSCNLLVTLLLGSNSFFYISVCFVCDYFTKTIIFEDLAAGPSKT